MSACHNLALSINKNAEIFLNNKHSIHKLMAQNLKKNIDATWTTNASEDGENRSIQLINFVNFPSTNSHFLFVGEAQMFFSLSHIVFHMSLYLLKLWLDLEIEVSSRVMVK